MVTVAAGVWDVSACVLANVLPGCDVWSLSQPYCSVSRRATDALTLCTLRILYCLWVVFSIQLGVLLHVLCSSRLRLSASLVLLATHAEPRLPCGWLSSLTGLLSAVVTLRGALTEPAGSIPPCTLVPWHHRGLCRCLRVLSPCLLSADKVLTPQPGLHQFGCRLVGFLPRLLVYLLP